MMNLDAFEQLARARRSVRKFLPTPISEELLTRLLDAAHWAPSGFNLQPTHFTVVTDTELKKQLHPACMNQKQILEAPAVVVFSGDREVAANNLEAILKMDALAGAVSPEYAALLRKFVDMSFSRGPLGTGWFFKLIAPPILRLSKPMPDIPAVEKKVWLVKQVMLTAMNFMLAAKSAGLDTVPMEGFDPEKVGRILNLPKSHVIPVVIPVGYAPDEKRVKTRLPLDRVVHHDRWSGASR
jgi:nitroreductase